MVPVANLAGSAGIDFLAAVRRSLQGRGFESLQIASCDDEYRVQDGRGARLSGPALLERIRDGQDPPILFFVTEDPRPEDLSLLKNGDTTLFLLGTEVPDLERAYLLLKGLAETEGGTLPALVPVAPPGGAWGRLAPARLAEAAVRFLGWRLPVWGGGDPEAASRLLSLRLERMRERRESGIEPLVRRLSLVLGGAR
jgi:hypothetical protein